MPRTVILVDTAGKKTGTADVVEAHSGEGLLHLAFSVYVLNPEQTKILMQRRSEEKMLWPMMWANTCCSHPFENESAKQAGERRLQEELGISVKLRAGSSFVYRAHDPSGKGVEYEYVVTLIGQAPESIDVHPDPKEVAEWKWISVTELQSDMRSHPDLYAPWFHIGIEKVLENR